MDKLKVLFALLLLACAAGASAQDVIVKKDGSTVVCRIVEVSASEIIYKKWTDLNGSNYVMNRTDASVINYENGTRSEMGTASTNSTKTTSSVVLNPQSQQTQQQLSDMQLMQMVSREKEHLTPLHKAKLWKGIGSGVGGLLIAGGIVWEIAASSYGDDTAKRYQIYGAIAIGSGVILGTSSVIIGNKKEKRALNELLNTSLWQQEIPLRNGTSLMAGIDRLQDRHTNTLGLGLRYSF